MITGRRVIAGMAPTAVPGVAPNYALVGGAAAPSPQMAAQRNAFLNIGGDGFYSGKAGQVGFGQAVGPAADTLHALSAGAGHMI